MAKKAANPKKLAASGKVTKAQASKKAAASPVKAKATSKASSKAKVKTETKKPAVMTTKPVAKEKGKQPEVVKQEVSALSSKDNLKVSQAVETTEKIKIDRDNMTDEQVKWAEMYNKYRDAQASQYDMKSTFKASSPLQHKVLGWGWIVSNDNDRLEVLFKDGKRILISNYRG